MRYKDPNYGKWNGNDKHGVWELHQYRNVTLCIRRTEDSKFIPMVGATKDVPLPDKPTPLTGEFIYNTFEEAEQHLKGYVDWVRDVWDTKAKQALNQRLHHMNPNVYPA
jgi:hypothetical protein